MRQLLTKLPRAVGLASAIALAGASVTLAASALPSRTAQARFATPATYRAKPRTTRAITYNRAAVPVGSSVRVTQSVNKWGGMDVRLQVSGLLPHERYRAEVHVRSCSADPASAGRAFQNGPSRQDYAANEFWLNFRTDASGAAGVLTRQYWGITKHQHAASVVIHVPRSATAVAACASVPFRRIWGW